MKWLLTERREVRDGKGNARALLNKTRTWPYLERKICVPNGFHIPKDTKMPHSGPPESTWEIGRLEISIFPLNPLKCFLHTPKLIYLQGDLLVLGHRLGQE